MVHCTIKALYWIRALRDIDYRQRKTCPEIRLPFKSAFTEKIQMNMNTKMKLNKMLNEKTIMTQQLVNGFILKTVKKIK
jgi:hypothetical protein